MQAQTLTKDTRIVSQGAFADLLDEKVAAQFLDLQAGTLRVWRSTGRYALPFIKIGKSVRYRQSDLEAWMAARFHANGATAGKEAA